MKKEVRQLRRKAIDSLVLSIDHFNRPWDLGRTEAVLILLDHSFEMLLKAAIRHRQGKIRKPREKQTIGFGACVRKGLTDIGIKFLSEEQALTLQSINGQRDAAQHYLIDMSEHQLYFYAQAGVTLFRDIHDDVFGDDLVVELPERVLPVSTTAPRDLTALFDKDVDEIIGLLAPGTRRKMDAIAKARSLAVLEGTVSGNYEQPSDGELAKICKRLADGEAWPTVFPGVASINITAKPDGLSISLRLTKNEGMPVRLLKEGEGSGAVVAVRRVNELGFYNLGAKQLAEHVGLTVPKCRAVIDHLELRKDAECFKEIRIGKSRHLRYSEEAIGKINAALEAEPIEVIWACFRAKQQVLATNRNERECAKIEATSCRTTVSITPSNLTVMLLFSSLLLSGRRNNSGTKTIILKVTTSQNLTALVPQMKPERRCPRTQCCIKQVLPVLILPVFNGRVFFQEAKGLWVGRQIHRWHGRR